MKKKLNDFIASIDKFDTLAETQKVILLSCFYTEILVNSEITTKNLKECYDLADLPSAQNFGGEIRQLLKTKKFIKTKSGYKLSRSAKKDVLSQIKISNKSLKNGIGQISLKFDDLHTQIKKVSKELFNDGYYSQAIFEAYKAVVNEVKDISGNKHLDGKPLMEQVFSVNNPIIKFNNLQSQSDKDEQVGLMFLFSGAALGIRNPKAHDYVIQKDPLRTLEYLFFASLLLKRLDEKI
ncbi:MAG: TIGR02391 family protein [Candidatus Levybacteria bacterium]|nr:TIGR02391 family protein [Candidatus Levybacteria bacterium]